MKKIIIKGDEILRPIELNHSIKSGKKMIKQNPYVGEDGIYIPCNEYVPEGCASAYNCVLTKEIFVEAYKKWISDK